MPRSFYERDTVQVAKELVGKLLVVRLDSKFALDDPRAQVMAGRIVETEAYHGDDPAAHCARGETPRCAIMFGDPGRAYVYFIYGMYEMLNFVTERKGYPGAVLIRALEPVLGQEQMQRHRPKAKPRDLTNGPGRLTQALALKLSHNGQELDGPLLFVVDDGFRAESIMASPRVGISKAKDRLWRFYATDHPCVSRVVARG